MTSIPHCNNFLNALKNLRQSLYFYSLINQCKYMHAQILWWNSYYKINSINCTKIIPTNFNLYNFFFH